MRIGGTSTNLLPWTTRLARLRELHVEVRTLNGIGSYLSRRVDGADLYFVLPSTYRPGETEAMGTVGPFMIDSICNGLKLDRRRDFPDWHDVV